MKDQELYSMKMHQVKELDAYTVVRRVPGGWIYTSEFEDMNAAWHVNSTFVPYIEKNNKSQIAPTWRQL